jgi:hypothetical protein
MTAAGCDNPRVPSRLLIALLRAVNQRQINTLLHRIDASSANPIAKRNSVQASKRRFDNIFCGMRLIALATTIKASLIADWLVLSKQLRRCDWFVIHHHPHDCMDNLVPVNSANPKHHTA